jgi:hypothetical protein
MEYQVRCRRFEVQNSPRQLLAIVPSFCDYNAQPECKKVFHLNLCNFINSIKIQLAIYLFEISIRLLTTPCIYCLGTICENFRLIPE